MKKINIQISNDTIASVAIRELNSQISESKRNSPEFQIVYAPVTACIEDLTSKAKKIARSGTTIHVNKVFKLPDTNIFIALDYPKKTGLIDKFKRIFKQV